MKVLVLGGGVVGVTSAYYLAQQGHEVTVVDRHASVASETSFANAGQISPGYASPWAAPGIPLKALKWMLEKHAPLAISLDGSLEQIRWMWRMYRNCNPTSYALNKSRMVRLAEYSRDQLRVLRESADLHYEERTGGTLQVFRTREQLDGVAKDVEVLRDASVPFKLFTDADSLKQAEPNINVHGLVGGLQLPNDETGDCQLFTFRLVERCQRMGVKLRLGRHIQHIQFDGRRVIGVHCGDDVLSADAYVVALGSYSPQLLRGLVSVPVYPVKGYSITVPLVYASKAPESTVLDETYKVALTRFENRIRVGGMAELRGFDLNLRARRQATLQLCLDDLFPGAGNTRELKFWTGLRPMTPDGTPIIGATDIPNLYLNTGHGTLGWTMACGSASVLADLISGKAPDIEHRDLDIRRYASRAN